MKIALAQLNYTVGDIEGNVAKILAAAKQAEDADLIVFSELSVCGYPPEDLVLRPSFQEASMRAVEALAKQAHDLPALLIGSIWLEADRLYNAALLLSGGEIIHKQFKHQLPNYSVFDEKRVFEAGPLPKPFAFKGKKLGVLICEDMWLEETTHKLKGADIICVLNGSPFDVLKSDLRQEKAAATAKATGASIIYVNQVGGQDEIVFDGASFVMDAAGKITQQFPAWEEVVGTNAKSQTTNDTYQALVTGLRDYVTKNGFPGVLLGLSGGVDSALVAAIAVDALGKEKVHAVMMPSRFTSKDSLEDAAECAKLLGIKYETIPITPAFEALQSQLKLQGLAEENIQSRIRGVILMGLSNQTGAMVVSTGNKSEMSVGYATLYGDMCGGYAPLKDVYKTTAYALVHWRNQQGRVIPERIITKAPTAELRDNQTDQDSLPPYPVLDAILKLLIESECSVQEIVGQGFEEATVCRVQKMLQNAEYKRRQAPPGVKITAKAFGRDRRYPITNKF
jgi:NAD+ synthase